MKFLKVGFVVFGALVITTLGISAADVFSGNSGSLLGQLIQNTEKGVCPAGMTEVVVGQTFSCVDIYEVSVSEQCPVPSPKSAAQTQENINTLECAPVSVEGAVPWTYVTRAQAQSLCARAGKRLPTATEWFTFAAATLDTNDECNTDSTSVVPAGSKTNCRSGAGVYDAVGNVWEWVSDDVLEGSLLGRVLPGEGYVSQVDASGVATETALKESAEFGGDYFWQEPEGVYGMLRGGFFGSEDDAGVYAIHAKTKPTDSALAVGFRCVR